MRHNQRVTLTIASGQSASDTLASALGYAEDASILRSINTVTVFSPATLTGTVTAQATPAFGGTFVNMSLQGTDITVPAARCVIIPTGEFGDFRLNSGSAEGAARAFTVVVGFDLP